MQVWIDNYTQELVVKKSPTAPPERYTMYAPSKLIDAYHEVWEVKGSNERIGFSYSRDYVEHRMVAQFRKEEASRHKVELGRLIRFEVPRKEYESKLAEYEIFI